MSKKNREAVFLINAEKIEKKKRHLSIFCHKTMKKRHFINSALKYFLLYLHKTA